MPDNSEQKKPEAGSTPPAKPAPAANAAQPADALKKPPVQSRRPAHGAPEEGFRLRLPRGKEMFGIVEQMSGASRMIVRCEDGKTRTCRVRGKMRKRIWVRQGDIVLVIPWDFQTADNKADIVWRYNPTQAGRLRREGRVKKLEKQPDELIL